MGIKSLLGFGQARDKPVRNYSNGEYSFNFGRSTSGKSVNEMTAMQTTAVYACVRILSEAIASLPIHVYRYKDGGKEMVCDHPLYTLLHDEPNPEMTSFVFRETLMSHLLIWGNAYADGFETREWMTVHTVWADIAPVSGKEYMASNRETAEITNKIYIRFRSGIKSTMRIKSAGCGPTSLADVLASLVSPYIDPLTLTSWARQHGYKAYKFGTSYSFFVPCAAEYGVKVRRLNTVNIYYCPGSASHNKALAELQAGNWLIACMGKGNWTKSGHYVVAYGYKDGMVYINDPASTKATRACNTWALFKGQVKYYWVVEVPEQIRQSGIVQTGDYRHEDFVREVQMCLRAAIDGKAGKQTLSKTITVSRIRNSKHNVVYPLQKLLKQCGFYVGELDKSAGKLFDAAERTYQARVVGLMQPDGEITAKGRSWRAMFGI